MRTTTAKPKSGRKRVTAIVTVDVDVNAGNFEVYNYIRDAVESWRGQLRPPGGWDLDDPGDPLFDLELHGVRPVRSEEE